MGQGAADLAGLDECACCAESPGARDDAGACTGTALAARSAAETAALRGAKAAADTSACIGMGGHPSRPCALDSWAAHTEPCGDGHYDRRLGWVGVVCDARGGRVVFVYLPRTGVGGELLPFFGRLGALLYLDLGNNPALRGDVADLAGATELRYLSVYNCPLVVGEAAVLAALVHLGEDCSVCRWDGTPGTGGLRLAGSGVHGPV
eukprot:COSAG04_NODE_5261_length_1681_cov_4.668142_1_plen_205_part_10